MTVHWMEAEIDYGSVAYRASFAIDGADTGLSLTAKCVRFVRAADYGPFDSPWRIPRARLGDDSVGITKASLTGEVAGTPPGTVGTSLEGGGVVVAAATSGSPSIACGATACR